MKPVLKTSSQSASQKPTKSPKKQQRTKTKSKNGKKASNETKSESRRAAKSDSQSQKQSQSHDQLSQMQKGQRKENSGYAPPYGWMGMPDGTPPMIPTLNQHNLFQLKRKLKRDILGSSLEKIVEEPLYQPKNLFSTLPTSDLVGDLKKWFGSLSVEQRIRAVTTRNSCLTYMLRYLYAKMEKEGNGEFAFDDEILNMFQHFQNAMKQMNPTPMLPPRPPIPPFESYLNNTTEANGEYLSPLQVMMSYRPVNERELYFKKHRRLDLDPQFSAKQHKLEKKLIDSVLLVDSDSYIDTMTLDSELLSNVDSLFSIMNVVSREKAFSKGPAPVRFDIEQHKFFWDNPEWFIARSYHTLGEWIVALVEKQIWRSYWEHLNQLNVFSSKVAGKHVQNTVINVGQISCSGSGMIVAKKQRIASLLLTERLNTQKFWENMEANGREEVLKQAFSNIEEKVNKEELEKDFKFEFISEATLNHCFPFFQKRPLIKKRANKEFERFRARALNQNQSNASSSESPDESSPRTSQDRKSSDEKITEQSWNLRDYAVSTLRNSGDLAQLIGRQIYLQVYERAKNAELDKLMFEEERKANTKKTKKKKRSKKTKQQEQQKQEKVTEVPKKQEEPVFEQFIDMDVSNFCIRLSTSIIEKVIGNYLEPEEEEQDVELQQVLYQTIEPTVQESEVQEEERTNQVSQGRREEERSQQVSVEEELRSEGRSGIESRNEIIEEEDEEEDEDRRCSQRKEIVVSWTDDESEEQGETEGAQEYSSQGCNGQEAGGAKEAAEKKKPRKRKHKKKTKKESNTSEFVGQPQTLPAGTIPTTLNSYGTVKGSCTPNIIAANQITFSEQVKKGYFKPEERKKTKNKYRKSHYDSLPQGYYPDIISSPYMDPYINFQMQDIMATAASVYQQQQYQQFQQYQPYSFPQPQMVNSFSDPSVRSIPIANLNMTRSQTFTPQNPKPDLQTASSTPGPISPPLTPNQQILQSAPPANQTPPRAPVQKIDLSAILEGMKNSSSDLSYSPPQKSSSHFPSLPGAHLDGNSHSANSSPQSYSPIRPPFQCDPQMQEEENEEEEEEEYALDDLEKINKYKDSDDMAYDDPSYYSLISNPQQFIQATAPLLQTALGSSAQSCCMAHMKCFRMEKEQRLYLNLSAQIQDYVEQVDTNVFLLKPIREATFKRIQKLIKACIQGERARSLRVELYGSHRSGIALQSSDIDIAVCGLPHANELPFVIDTMNELAQYLKKDSTVTKVRVIDGATVPIIKLQIDQPTLFAEEGIKRTFQDLDMGDPMLSGFSQENVKKIQVDISFDDSYGVSRMQSNCLMSSNYSTRVISSDSRVRLLVILIKKILHLNNLNTSYLGGFSSYSIVLLVQAFFKQFQLNQTQYTPGKIFIDFLDFFGNRFDNFNSIINPSNNPPIYRKSMLLQDPKEPQVCMTLMDPTTKTNSTKGAYKTMNIKCLFSMIHCKLMHCGPEPVKNPLALSLRLRFDNVACPSFLVQ